ncbi:MAG TPA: hypothetical protein VK817_08830 [Trebonia sp.]|jgi:hypothetical protein|nr:hypothetical protein [Trebonia sp.]
MEGFASSPRGPAGRETPAAELVNHAPEQVSAPVRGELKLARLVTRWWRR